MNFRNDERRRLAGRKSKSAYVPTADDSALVIDLITGRRPAVGEWAEQAQRAIEQQFKDAVRRGRDSAKRRTHSFWILTGIVLVLTVLVLVRR